MTFAVSGCGADDASMTLSDAAADRGSDGMQVIRYELLPEQDELALERGESGTLSVRLQTLKGVPVKGVAVSFALSGQALDSSLDALSATTDRHGVASNAVLAGARESNFEIRISAEGAQSVYVPVAVFPAGFGAIEVTATYAGRHDPALRKVSLYADLDCDSIDGETPVTSSTSPGLSDGIASFFLAAGKVYAVVVEVLGGDDTALASGCVDGLSVVANHITSTKVPYVDNALSADGQFDVAFVLDGSDVGAIVGGIVEQALFDRVVAAALPGASDTAEAAFLLTALQRTLSSDPALLLESTSLALELVSNGLLKTLQDELDKAKHGPLSAAQAIADVATGSLDELAIDASVTLASGPLGTTAIWQSQSIRAPSLNSSLAAPSHTYPEWPQLVLDVSSNPNDDTLSLGGVAMYLPLLDLADQAVHQAAVVGVDDEPPLTQLLGCDTLLSAWRTWAKSQLGGSSCGADCGQAACDRAIANLLTATDSALSFDNLSSDVLPNGNLDIELQLLSVCDTESDCVSLQTTDLHPISVSAQWQSSDHKQDAMLLGSTATTLSTASP